MKRLNKIKKVSHIRSRPLTKAKEINKIKELMNFARNWKKAFVAREESLLLKTIAAHFSQKGLAPSLTDIQLAMRNFSVRQIRLMMKCLVEEGLVVVSKDGRITGALGFSSRPTNHTLTFTAGPSVNVWCALDAIGIPAALRRDAHIVSSCPRCTSKIEVTMKNGSLQGFEPESSVLFTIMPWRRSKNVSEDICPYINLFCSDAHLASWRSENMTVDGIKLSIPQASSVAKSFFEELL